MLVINALRAAKRRPMHFTSVVTLSLPVPGASPSVSFTIPLSSEAVGAAATTPSIRADVPSFNVGVLDSQKFMQGITTPLRPGLVRHYVEQGRPPMLLLSLMIREIAYVAPDGTERRVANYPGSREEFEAFQAELRAMVACGLALVEEDPVEGIEAPAFRLPENTGLLAALTGTAREGLVVVPQKDKTGAATGRWQLARPRADVVIAFEALQSPACLALPERQRRRFRESEEAASAARGAVMDYRGPEGSPRAIRMMTRSPEAILYYLGELVRAEHDGDADGVRYIPRTTIDLQEARRAAIFRVRRDEAPGAFISVDYDGARYSVGSSAADRSAQSLALVAQLISLQKEASELPINVAPIRLIGQ